MSIPFLEIRVEEEGSVPIVICKGEEISNKVSIRYEWVTRSEEEGLHELMVKHYVKDEPEVQMINWVRDTEKNK